MVTFVIDNKDSAKAVYRYYPENHMDSSFGMLLKQLQSAVALSVAI